ncbi:MAG: hypothetical protein ACT4NU_06810 [Chromatiales bacterium]
MSEKEQSDQEAMMQSTSKWTSFRAYCHLAHEDGSGAYTGEWRSSAERAQADSDAHDQDKHEGLQFARIEFK